MNLGIYANITKPLVRETLQSFCRWAVDHDLHLLSSQSLHDFLRLDENVMQVVSEDIFIQESDFILVMGGDGSMLAAARMVGASEVPLLGVNLGSLGFLAEISVENLFDKIEAVLAGNYQIQKRMVLKTDFISAGNHYKVNALNDVVIHRGGTSRIIQVDVQVNHQNFNTYHADGLIVATATGSTAYSLSSGGPILIPEMDALILNPICPHTLTARPAVIPGNHHIRVQVLSEDHTATITIDGQVSVDLDNQTEINIQKAPYQIQSVTFSDSSFFDVLRKKLQWGSIPRQ